MSIVIVSLFIQRNVWFVQSWGNQVSATLRKRWILLHSHLQAIRSVLDCGCRCVCGVFGSDAHVLRNYGTQRCRKLEIGVRNGVRSIYICHKIQRTVIFCWSHQFHFNFMWLPGDSLPIEPIGVRIFFVQLLCHIFVTFWHFVIYSASGSFHMGTALYVSAMSTDIGCAFGSLGSIAGAQSAQREYAMKATLRKVIEFHGEIIRIRESLKNIMSAILFVKVINMGIFFALCLVQMEVVSDVSGISFRRLLITSNFITFLQGMKNPQPELYISFNSVCINILVVYADCYYSNMVTESTSQIANDAYNCPWYTYSTSARKPIALIIQQSQTIFYYTGLGLMQCSLPTFSMVIYAHCEIGRASSNEHLQTSSNPFASICRPWTQLYHISCCWKVSRLMQRETGSVERILESARKSVRVKPCGLSKWACLKCYILRISGVDQKPILFCAVILTGSRVHSTIDFGLRANRWGRLV